MASPSRLHDSGDQSPSLLHSRHCPYSSLKQPSVLFRTMLRNIADQLTTEEVSSLVYIHSIGKSGRDPNERPTALDVFRSLEKRAVFSLDSLEPLEEILDGIQRHDLVTTVVKDFKVKLIGKRQTHFCYDEPTARLRAMFYVRRRALRLPRLVVQVSVELSQNQS